MKKSIVISIIIMVIIFLGLMLWGNGALESPTEPTLPSPGPGFDDSTVNRDVGAGSPGQGSGPICTMDAKECPDGSYVSRTGPHCEFAPCPGEK